MTIYGYLISTVIIYAGAVSFYAYYLDCRVDSLAAENAEMTATAKQQESAKRKSDQEIRRLSALILQMRKKTDQGEQAIHDAIKSTSDPCLNTVIDSAILERLRK